MRLGREKILIFGDAKSGKTRSACTFIRGLPQSKFVVLEPDDGFEKVARELGINYDKIDKNTKRLSRVSLFRPIPRDWGTYYGYLEQIDTWCNQGQLGVDDWVLTESLDIVVERMKSEFSDKTAKSVIEKSQDTHLSASSWNAYIERRKKGSPILEANDYRAIYAEFESALDFFALTMPCNWICTEGIDEISREGTFKDSQKEQSFYLALGLSVKPAGYKEVPRLVDTLIVLGRNPATGYTFKVAGDRGANLRGWDSSRLVVPPDQPNKDLFQDYLVRMAGWQAATNGSVAVPPPPPAIV